MKVDLINKLDLMNMFNFMTVVMIIVKESLVY